MNNKLWDYFTGVLLIVVIVFYTLVGKVLSWIFGTDIFGGKK